MSGGVSGFGFLLRRVSIALSSPGLAAISRRTLSASSFINSIHFPCTAKGTHAETSPFDSMCIRVKMLRALRSNVRLPRKLRGALTMVYPLSMDLQSFWPSEGLVPRFVFSALIAEVASGGPLSRDSPKPSPATALNRSFAVLGLSVHLRFESDDLPPLLPPLRLRLPELPPQLPSSPPPPFSLPSPSSSSSSSSTSSSSSPPSSTGGLVDTGGCRLRSLRPAAALTPGTTQPHAVGPLPNALHASCGQPLAHASAPLTKTDMSQSEHADARESENSLP